MEQRLRIVVVYAIVFCFCSLSEFNKKEQLLQLVTHLFFIYQGGKTLFASIRKKIENYHAEAP